MITVWDISMFFVFYSHAEISEKEGRSRYERRSGFIRRCGTPVGTRV